MIIIRNEKEMKVISVSKDDFLRGTTMEITVQCINGWMCDITTATNQTMKFIRNISNGNLSFGNPERFPILSSWIGKNGLLLCEIIFKVDVL